MSYLLIIIGAIMVGMSGYFSGGFKSPHWLSPALMVMGAIVECIGIFK